MHKFNFRLTAVFLLLVLVQSIGIRLMLHNKFHQSAPQLFSKSSATYIQSPCDCMDDCLTPSIQARGIEIVAPETAYTVVKTKYAYQVTSIEKLYRSLRAPPAI